MDLKTQIELDPLPSQISQDWEYVNERFPEEPINPPETYYNRPISDGILHYSH
jgi:hypothetical protein